MLGRVEAVAEEGSGAVDNSTNVGQLLRIDTPLRKVLGLENVPRLLDGNVEEVNALLVAGTSSH